MVGTFTFNFSAHSKFRIFVGVFRVLSNWH